MTEPYLEETPVTGHDRSAPQYSDKGAVLSVRNLKVRFETDDGEVKAVDGVSFDVDSDEVLGIVG